MSAIYLLRHGQASFMGDDYDALSALGEEQARVLGLSLRQRGLSVNAVVCGGMRRHHQTACTALAQMQLPLEWHVDEGWNEFDHNDVLAAVNARYRQQGALAAELAGAADPKAAFRTLISSALQRWASGEYDMDYREPWAKFHARVADALRASYRMLAPHQTVLVFTSGGAIASVCRSLMELDDQHTWNLNWRIANASITKLVGTGSNMELSCFNEHGYLECALAAVTERRLITYF